MFPIPTGTQLLLLLNIGVYAIQFLTQGQFSDPFELWPIGSEQAGGWGFEPWQLVTYSFFHEGIWHITLNMFALWMFGSDVERVWGRNRYLTYYFVCVLSAALTQLLFTYITQSPYPTVGASGGIFGLLLAFALLFPRRTVILAFPPIPMPAWLFVTLYGALELFQGTVGTQSGVAHFAHLGGMLGGWLIIRYGRTRSG
jgi:membrane associated rhomboid family serine protease